MHITGRPLRALFVDNQEDLFDRQSMYPISALLKKIGVEVGYVCSRRPDKLLKQVLERSPDLVMYSAFSHNMPGYAAFDAVLKQHSPVTSVIGGFGPTFNPGYIDKTTIDAACVGEADLSLPDFIANGFHSCKNFYVKGEPFRNELYPLTDLDSLPIPDRSLVYDYDIVRANNPSKQFLSGRGCPYLCSYCFNHSYNDIVKAHGEKIIRKKSVDYLFEEINSVRKKYPLNMIIFNDDTFIINREWFFEFCEQFPSRIGIQYGCNLRANLVDEDIVRALKQSNCVAINWSIESGDDAIRNGILKRNMSDGQILHAAELFNRYGIRHRIGNIIGLPGETKEQMLKTIELNARTRPAFALANIFVPYPGLDITKYAIDNSYYTEIPEDELPKSFFSHSVLSFPDDVNNWLQKMLYLFPFFVRFHALYKNRFTYRLMFMLPKFILRPVYEIYYGVVFRSVYRVKSTFKDNVRFCLRYLKTIIDY